MVRGEYIRRGEKSRARARRPTPRARYYGERISGAIQAAGSSIADVGQQLGEWLKRLPQEGDDE